MIPSCFAYCQEICFKKCPSSLHALFTAKRFASKNVLHPCMLCLLPRDLLQKMSFTPACFACCQEICFEKCPSPLHALLTAKRFALKNVFLPDSFIFNISPSSMLEFPAMAFMIGRRILLDLGWDSPAWLGLCRFQQKTHDYTARLICAT